MAARVPRQERGEQRRDALLAAAVEVLEVGGPAAFSARSVAGQAGLPLAAVSYYFPTLDDLLGAAIAVVVRGWVDHGEAVVGELEKTAERHGTARAATAIGAALLPSGGAPQLRRRYEQLLAAASYPVAAAAMADLRPRLRVLVERILLSTGATSVIGADGLIALLDGAAIGAVSESAGGRGNQAVGDVRGRIESTLRTALAEQYPAGQDAAVQSIQSSKDRPEIRS